VEKRLLEEWESQVLIISADEASVGAMGTNVLDPANRKASAETGLKQGERLAESVQQFWS
jgi:NTE family protein